MTTTNLGLSVSDVVNVSVQLSPTGAAQRNFGSLLILGDSNVIDVSQRYRQYASLAAVAGDFGSTAPEYLAAAIFFDQTPTPALLYIGAWARTAQSGVLVGSILSATQQAITNFTSITNGGLTITVDGAQHAITGMNFASVTNLNGVASIFQTALAGSATVTWDATNTVFRVKSASTGTSSSVTFATAPGNGTDVSGLLGLTSAAGGYVQAGIAAETPLAAVTALALMTNAWYGLMFAAATPPAASDHIAVAGFIQGSSPSHIYGVTTQDTTTLNANTSTDLASQLQALAYTRTFIHYSSSSPYACAGIFGNAFTVNFNGSTTTITIKFKQDVGVTAETLTETQAAALNQKNCNVFVNYNNATAIIQQGQMCSGVFFDTIHGTDWLQNDIQTAIYNDLYSATKIPQTDAGVTRLINDVTGCLHQAVVNGLVAPGVWLGPAVGAIVTGQTLPNGYYVYAPQVSTQSAAARAARQAPVIQACIKLAGAIHSASVILSVSN